MPFSDLINMTRLPSGSFYVLTALAAIVCLRPSITGSVSAAAPETRSPRYLRRHCVPHMAGSAVSDVRQALLDGVGQRVPGQDQLTAHGSVTKQG
jgi:hypothetical protein